MDVMQQASTWLEQQRAAFRTIPVTYQRGTTTATVNATVSRSEFDVDDGAGAPLRIETRDYLIAASALVAAGFALPPQRRDVVVEGTGPSAMRYEVVTPAHNIPAWRWSDRFRTRLRIHTNLVTTEPTGT